jgi:type VI secretion system protein ImpJ
VVAQRFKVGAPDNIEKFALSAMPGVRLQHALQVPPALAVRPDTYSFTLHSKGQMYERLVDLDLSAVRQT